MVQYYMQFQESTGGSWNVFSADMGGQLYWNAPALSQITRALSLAPKFKHFPILAASALIQHGGKSFCQFTP